MTLVLVWKSDDEIAVIADTLFMGAGKAGLEIGPKIFSVPIRLFQFGVAKEPRSCLNMGFAFAGHTAAGQVTNALASAGLQNLIGEDKPCPTVREVADYYGRCAAYVVGEMRRHYASDQFLFESVVFGWQDSAAVAYNVEPIIDANGKPGSKVEELDFQKFGMFAYGKGHAEAQAFIDATWAAGRKANAYQTLMAVVRDEGVPSVGGGIQAAMAGAQGVELKPILLIGEDGVGRGGFMGAEQSALGSVGDFHPLSLRPVILDARSIEEPHSLTPAGKLV